MWFFLLALGENSASTRVQVKHSHRDTAESVSDDQSRHRRGLCEVWELKRTRALCVRLQRDVHVRTIQTSSGSCTGLSSLISCQLQEEPRALHQRPISHITAGSEPDDDVVWSV